MKAVLSLFALLFAGSFQTYAQPQEWKTIYSSEFHFIASFPEEPRESSEGIDLGFARGSARKWFLDLPGISYQVLVVEFADFSVGTDNKSSAPLYGIACPTLTGYRCTGGFDQFGVLGRYGWGNSRSELTEFAIFITGKHLYLAKVVGPFSPGMRPDNVKKFIDGFLFIHPDEKEKKWTWGLPVADAN